MWVYITLQYFFARYVATQLNKVDPSYFDLNGEEGSLPVGIKTSFGITQMIFDADLPEPDYPRALKIQIYTARVIFAGAFILFLVLILV